MSSGTLVSLGQHVLFLISALFLSYFDWRRSTVLMIGSFPAVLGLVVRVVWAARSGPEQIQAAYSGVLFLPLYVVAGRVVARCVRQRSCRSKRDNHAGGPGNGPKGSRL